VAAALLAVELQPDGDEGAEAGRGAAHEGPTTAGAVMNTLESRAATTRRVATRTSATRAAFLAGIYEA
jgi:hypothetical protein